jgi:hypothetical protein
MNGALNKILATVIAGLLLAAALGTYSASGRLASLEATVDGLNTTIAKIDDRVTYLERERYDSR